METSINPDPLNCSLRYASNETNVNPIPLYARYSGTEILNVFMPGTLILVRVLMITWLTVGVFGNSLSFVIWVSKQQRRKNTSAIYLSALALADLVLILTLVEYHVTRYWGLRGVHHAPGICHIYQCLTILSQYYSTTLVFGFTLERYLAVCFPFKRHRLCTAKRAIIAVLILLLICLIPTVVSAVMYTFTNGECKFKEETPTIRLALLVVEALFSLVVPLATLLFNLLLLKEMRRLIKSTALPTSARPNGTASLKLAGRTRQSSAYSLQSNGSNAISRRTDIEHPRRESSGFVATTVMLVILSFYLIACTVPPGAVYVAQFFWPEGDHCLSDEVVRTDPDWLSWFSKAQMKEIIDVLCASHYALNFFIYILTSKAFRDQVISILSCNKNRLRRLSKPSATEAWTLPRRTGPRSMLPVHVEEQETLLDVSDATRCSTTANIRND